MATTFAYLMDRYQAWVARRAPWMPYWQELGDVLLPNRADFTRKRSPGSSRETRIFDGTPRLALRDLASTLDGLMKPKTSNWFEPTVEDEKAAEADEAKLWFQAVRERMWRAIYRKDARFIQRSGETDQGLACWGWGTLWMQQNRNRDGLLFRTFHNAQVALDENEDGIIDRIGVEETMRPHQIQALYKRAGKDEPQKLREAQAAGATKKKDTEFKVVQIVLPRDDRDANRIDARNMEFASAVLDITSEEIIAETGFPEFPAAVPRWETAPGEVYPRSPGMMALPDAKTLQAMGKTLLVGGQRAVDPPVWVQSDTVVSPFRTFPGGITVLDLSDTQGNQPMGTLPVATNIPLGREMQQDTRNNVEAAFFKNVFNLPIEAQQMTATEVLERKEQFIRTIGPVFGRLETDYIGHIAERVFALMENAGAFPPRPDILEGHRITFRFQSPIQQARKAIEIAGMARAVDILSPLGQFQPEIWDNFDGDEIARDTPEWSGLPQKWMRTIEKRDQVRQQRQEAAAAQDLGDRIEPLSKAQKNVVDAEVAAEALGQ